MTIETKYNIGDEVSYKPLNPFLSSVHTGEILNIKITIFDNGLTIHYLINGDNIPECLILDKNY